MNNLTDIEQEARDWRNQLEPFQYDTDAQMLAAFHKFMLSKATATPLSEKLETLKRHLNNERVQNTVEPEDLEPVMIALDECIALSKAAPSKVYQPQQPIMVRELAYSEADDKWDTTGEPEYEGCERELIKGWVWRKVAIIPLHSGPANPKQVEGDKIREAIMSALKNHTQEMEGYAYFSSNPGVPEDDFEYVADDVLALLTK